MPIARELRHFYRGERWEAARAAVLERARGRCERCGEEVGTHYLVPDPRATNGVLGRWVVVQIGVAHLNWVAGDDRPENLAALCRACHLRHDANVHAARARSTRCWHKDLARPLLVEASA